MEVISNTLLILTSQWSASLRLLAGCVLGALLCFGLLRLLFQEQLASDETFALALSGWSFLWVGSAFLGFFLNRVLNFGPIWTAFLFAVSGLVLLYGWKHLSSPWGKPTWILLALCLVFLLALLTRMAFLANLIVPSYFDGSLHYALSQGLLKQFGTFPWQNPTLSLSGYYHFGFHLLVASFSAWLGTGVNQTILWLGQLTLAILPIPLFFIVRRASNSAPAAFFALLLAGWGWSMPAHALNWGKYPALLSLLALQFTLALAYCAVQASLSARNKWLLAGLLLASSLVAGLIHTRALVVIVLLWFSYWAASFWQGLSNRKLRLALPALLFAGLAGLVLYLNSRELLKLVFDPYLRDGWWITLLVAALAPFAFKRFSTLALAATLSLVLLLLALLLPLPVEPFQTSLDRPFVQMVLYLPLALLGGLGLAGLQTLELPRGWLRWLTVAIFGVVFFQIGVNYHFSASPCCILFKSDDAVATDWMNEHTPREAKILIAGNVLNVFDVENPSELRGADGGIWITPLTGRQTVLARFGTDFTVRETWADLCQRGLTYIYVGGTLESFSQEKLEAQPGWYSQEISLPGAHLFRLIGCS